MFVRDDDVVCRASGIGVEGSDQCQSEQAATWQRDGIHGRVAALRVSVPNSCDSCCSTVGFTR